MSGHEHNCSTHGCAIIRKAAELIKIMSDKFPEPALLEMAAQYLNTTPDHLRELVQAEKDGRLVVPPCKVGDTVYLTYGDCVIEAEVTCIRPFVFKDKTEFRGNAAWRYEDPFYNDGRILEQDMFIVFGKTAFLTREEAEAALKGGAE